MQIWQANSSNFFLTKMAINLCFFFHSMHTIIVHRDAYPHAHIVVHRVDVYTRIRGYVGDA